MTIKCPQCHFENPSDTDYCGMCAAPLKAVDEAAVSHTKTLQVPMKELTLGSTFDGRYQIIVGCFSSKIQCGICYATIRGSRPF